MRAHNKVALEVIFSARESGKIEIMVSRHSLDELSRKPDDAYELAKAAEILPYWPIGSIAELVGSIADLSGTWEDARRNEDIQQELKNLAKSRNDIRDRGAYIDALLAKADAFVTSDQHFVASRPARSIEKRFGLRVLTPFDLAKEITSQRALL